jgi:membrane protease YdiL (CAAX protease family)
MRLASKPSPAMTATTLAVGYASFAATFLGPKEKFWQRMTRTGLLLGGAALATDAEVREARPTTKDLATGAAIAAALYAVFTVGDKAARVIMPSGAEDIGEVYALRTLRPKGEIAARLAGIVGPAEELYWRGMLQSELTRRHGAVKGAALATAAYSGVHVCTRNPTLIGAATVAGAGWSALRALGVSMPALVVSHIIWDIWIFLVQPTQPLD